MDIIVPSCHHLGPHVRASWPLWGHLGPSWLHFGLLLGTTCSPKCSQGAQDATRTSKTTLRAPIFNDLGIIITADLKKLWLFVSFFYLFIHLFTYLLSRHRQTHTHKRTHAYPHTYTEAPQKHIHEHRHKHKNANIHTDTHTHTHTTPTTTHRHTQRYAHTDMFCADPSTRKNQQK